MPWKLCWSWSPFSRPDPHRIRSLLPANRRNLAALSGRDRSASQGHRRPRSARIRGLSPNARPGRNFPTVPAGPRRSRLPYAGASGSAHWAGSPAPGIRHDSTDPGGADSADGILSPRRPAPAAGIPPCGFPSGFPAGRHLRGGPKGVPRSASDLASPPLFRAATWKKESGETLLPAGPAPSHRGWSQHVPSSSSGWIGVIEGNPSINPPSDTSITPIIWPRNGR